MKLSNKLFIGTVLFVIVAILLHYLSLALMQRMGWYSEKVARVKMEYFYPENIKVIRIKSCRSVYLNVADTFHYSIYNESHEFFKSETRGDTLILRGDTTIIDTVFKKGKMVRIDTLHRSFDEALEIFLTGSEKMEGFNCTFYVGSANAYSNLKLLLNNSELQNNRHYRGMYQDYDVKIKKLSVDARNNSTIDFGWKGEMDSVNISLEDFSFFRNTRSGIRAGVIYYSDSSGIDMRGHHFRNVRMVCRKAELKNRKSFYRYNGDDY